MSSNQPTDEGKRHVDRWREAQTDLSTAKSRLSTAECELANATAALGKWMCPADAKVGEKFCVWYGDSLIEVELSVTGSYKVSARNRGRSLNRS